MSQALPVQLIGLPGCGVSTLKLLFKQAPLWVVNALEGQVLTLINMAETLPNNWGTDYLRRCLEVSNGVVFTFVEQADLDCQMAWQQWLKNLLSQHDFPNLTRFRILNRQLPASLFKDDEASLSAGHALLRPSKQPFNKLSLPKIQEMIFSVKRINIEHLWPCLDASKQHPTMQLLRLKGQVLSYQYRDPVAIEVTSSEMKTYAVADLGASEEQSGGLLEGGQNKNQLVIQGVDLDEKWLSEILQACQYP